MAVIDGRTWLEHLSLDECWEALARSSVGRVGVVVDGAPEIYPVNFVVDGHSVVFRTDPGNKLRGLDRSPSVCFEVDLVDPDAKTGWSVLVKGPAIEVMTAEGQRALRDLPLELWAFGDKSHWIRIRAHEVTGRRIHRGSETAPSAS